MVRNHRNYGPARDFSQNLPHQVIAVFQNLACIDAECASLVLLGIHLRQMHEQQVRVLRAQQINRRLGGCGIRPDLFGEGRKFLFNECSEPGGRGFLRDGIEQRDSAFVSLLRLRLMQFRQVEGDPCAQRAGPVNGGALQPLRCCNIPQSRCLQGGGGLVVEQHPVLPGRDTCHQRGVRGPRIRRSHADHSGAGPFAHEFAQVRGLHPEGRVIEKTRVQAVDGNHHQLVINLSGQQRRNG